MSLRSWLIAKITGFRGAWTAASELEGRPERAFTALNVIYPYRRPSTVRTREGTSNTPLIASGAVSSMYYWVTSQLSKLVFFEGGANVRMYDLVDHTIADLFTQAGSAISLAEAGNKAYMSVVGADGLGTSQLRIVYPEVFGSPADVAFMGPGTVIPAFTEFPGVPGNMTKGAHLFGYILISRSGHETPPGPANPGNGIFVGVPFTITNNDETLGVNIYFTDTPSDYESVQMIMTTVENHNRWWKIPGAVVPVAPNQPTWPAIMFLSISDDDLTATADEVVNEFDYLARLPNGTGPFNPSVVLIFNNRMVSIVDTKAYVSDPQDYEATSEALHVVHLPGYRRMVTAMVIRGVIYWLGPGWTYSSADSGDYPVAWAQPEEISGYFGTTAPLGVTTRTQGDYGWVANESGLFLFNGKYPDKPLNHLNSDDWARINWTVPGTIQVKDDPLATRVYVTAPLDGATSPTHILMWDYSRCEDAPVYDAVDYSIWQLPTFPTAIEMVPDANGRRQLWIGPGTAGNVVSLDSSALNDVTVPINSAYETGWALDGNDVRTGREMFGWLRTRVIGVGTLHLSINTMDRRRTILPPLALTNSTTPGQSFVRKFSLQTQNLSVRYEVNPPNDPDNPQVAGAWFEAQGLEVAHKPWSSY